MREHRRIKRTLLLGIFTVIITVAFVINSTYGSAKEIDDINPAVGFESIVLQKGETATYSIVTTTPFDVHTVSFLSLGNATISANVIDITSTASGIWWVALMGTAPRNWYDFSYGFYVGVAPHPGTGTQINVNKTFSFGLAIGCLILDPAAVSAESPVEYSIKIN